MDKQKTDICLILEGTYPYISGGVSTWTHELIKAQNHLTFSIISLLPPNYKATLKYNIPKNVISIKKVFLQSLPAGIKNLKNGNKELFNELELPILNLQTKPSINELRKIIISLNKHKGKLGHKILLESDDAWNTVLRMYNSTMGDTPFLDYFWTWRALMGGLFSVLLAELPDADIYHSLCTGYAGLMLARANIEKNKPCLLTEHGIYTNERRIEIASANWLDDKKEFSLDISKNNYEKELRDFWIDSFYGYSNCCYQACEKIITLYKGNQDFQLMDGADPNKLMIISNGVEYDKFANIKKEANDQPTIALIGRVVPIKDIKSFIRSVNLVKNDIPNIKAYIMGPSDEDPEYNEECLKLTNHLNLQKNIEFTGKVKITDYLGKIDVLVLTSISEAQPLVILEAGAARIPTITTNVGACEEMIFGIEGNDRKIGPGGSVCSLSNPREIANELIHMFSNKEFFESCQNNAQERVYKYYNKVQQNAKYSYLYYKLKNLQPEEIQNAQQKIEVN